MPQFIPDVGVVGLLAPKVGVDAEMGLISEATTLTDVFTSVGDAPSGGTVTILYSPTAGGGGSGITVTIADGATSGTATGSIALSAGATLYRRITAESGLALNLGGYATVALSGITDTVLATLGDLKLHLDKTGTGDDVALTFCLAAASSDMEASLGRSLLRVPYTSEKYDVAPFQDFVLREYPVNPTYSSRAVTEGSTALTNDDDYQYRGAQDHAPVRLRRMSGAGGVPRKWTEGEVTVTYEAGYAQVPAAIRNAVVEMAAHLWRQRVDSGRSQLGLSSKTPANGSAESYLPELPHIAHVIQTFKRKFA